MSACCFGFFVKKNKRALTVRILSASGLRNTDRGLFRRFGDASDPYAVITGGGVQLSTATLQNTLEPRWEEEPWTLALGDSEAHVVVTVMDSDLLVPDELLGKAQVDLKPLEPGKKQKKRLSLGEGNGEVQLELELKLCDAKAHEELRQKVLALQKAQEGGLSTARAGAQATAGTVATVVVHSAAGLRNTDRGLFRRGGDCSDPYVQVSVGDQRLTTTTVDNCLDPVWNSPEFTFSVGSGPLRLEVFDSDLLTFDDKLGSAEVALMALKQSQWHELKESLGPGNGEIRLKVRVEPQAQQRLERARRVREQLAAEQAEQQRLAKATAAQGAGDVLTVAVVAASGLRNTDKGLFRRGGDASDPYVVVSAGGQKLRTKTVNNDLNPVWDSEWFSFTLGEADGELSLEVYDSDLLSFDDLLGKARLDVAGLAAGEWLQRKESLGDGNGEIELKLRLERQGRTRREKADSSREQLAQRQQKELEAAKAKAAEGAGNVLTVVVAAARGLRNTDRGLFRRSGDASDPYAVVSVGRQKLRTATIDNCLDPVWNSQEFSFTLEGGEECCQIEVYDSDLLTFDDLLGSARIDLGALGFGKWLPVTQSLGEGNGEVEFKVRLEKQEAHRLAKAQRVLKQLEGEQADQVSLAKAKAALGSGDVLTVAVISASGLPNTDRGLFRRSGDSSDPYVLVSAGGQQLRTATIDNDLNPVWNSEWFSFVLKEADRSLQLQVYDSDLLTFDDLLGQVTVDLGSVEPGSWFIREEPLKDGTGSIQFQLRLEKQQVPRLEKAEGARAKLEVQQAEQLSAAKAKAEEGAGDVLTVSVCRATGLRNTDRGLFRRSGDASDPYTVVSVGKQKLCTATIDNCLDPVWNSPEFQFTLAGGETSLQLTVFDSDLLTFDDELGSASVALAGLAAGEWLPMKQSLGAGNGEIEFRLRLERQGSLRLAKAQAAREELAKEQEEQQSLAKAKAKLGSGDVLTVAVVSASGLRNTDRGLFRRSGDASDPYVVVSAGGKKLRTAVINNDLNPVWNKEWFSFTLGEGASRELQLQVFDSDLLTSDELLGEARVNVDALAPGQWHTCRDSLGEGNGELEVQVRLEPQQASRVQRAEHQRAELQQQQEQQLQAMRAQEEQGSRTVLSAVVLSASGLRNTDRGLFRRGGDCSDPYAVVSHGGQRYWTKTVNDCLEPVWDSQEFTFELGEGPLLVDVFDRDWLTFDDVLGSAKFDTARLLPSTWHELRSSLGEGNGEVVLRVRLEPQPRGRVERAAATGEKIRSELESECAASRASAADGAGRVVSINALAARGLANTEGRLSRMLGGNSDPFVVARVGESQLSTHIVWDTSDPVWSEGVMSFATSDPEPRLRLEIYDWDLIGSNDLLGTMEVELAAVKAGEWVPVSKVLEEQPNEAKGELSFDVRVELQEKGRMIKVDEERQRLEAELKEAREQQGKEHEKKQQESL